MTGTSFTGSFGFYSATLRRLRWTLGSILGATSIGLFATGAVALEAVLVYGIAPPSSPVQEFL